MEFYGGGVEPMRLFVALDLPWETREKLSDLALGLQGARWIPPENLHVTLRFIGETPRHVAEEIAEALAALRGRSFALEIAGVGVFEKSGRLSTVWAGVVRNPALDHLQSKIETALQRTGLEPERRRFAPHITLARLDGSAEPARIMAWVQAHNLFRTGPVQVGHFTLFSSRLGKEQSAYTPEVEYELA
jgi:2'-5' RNA ligase